jgi:hypothetical protein
MKAPAATPTRQPASAPAAGTTIDQPKSDAPAPGTAVATSEDGGMMIGGKRIRVIKSVTRPVLQQLLDGTPVFVTIQALAFRGQELTAQKRDGSVKMEPARLLNVLNIETGDEATLIANSVLENELLRNYPGKWISAKMTEKKKNDKGEVTNETMPWDEIVKAYYAAESTIPDSDKPTYAGKSFAISSMMAPPPRKYRVYNVKEIEIS